MTQLARIERQVAWKEGEPFSQAKIAETQQNLARTGAFRTIELRPQPVDPENQERNVDLQLAEARRISLLYGFGYQNVTGATENRNDVFGIAGATYRNLFGSMRTASLEVQYAPISGRGHVFASFLEPYLFNTNVPLTLVVFAAREPIQDIDIDRLGGFLESVRLFGQHLRVGLRYEYQQIAPRNPEDLSTIELEKFPKSDRPIKQSAIGPSFSTTGATTSWTRTAATTGRWPGSTRSRSSPRTRATGRSPRRPPGSRRSCAACSACRPARARSSRTVRRRRRASPSRSASSPGARRPAAGSTRTCSAFPGSPSTTTRRPRCTPRTRAGLLRRDVPGDPRLALYDCSAGPRIIGGNGFMAWSFEYRLPILGNLGVSVFYDLAQVWENAGDINFHIEGANGPATVDRRRPPLHDADRTAAARVRPPAGSADDSLRGHDRRTRRRDCPAPPCTLKTGLTTKESGRIFLSIGYPF